MMQDYLERVAGVAAVVREHALKSERDRHLADAIVDALHAAGLYRMMLPVHHGGGDLTMAEAFPVIEAMSRVDGATGWNLCIGSTGMLITALQMTDDEARCAVLDEPKALLAGGVNPLGVRAVPVEGGYRFDGRVPFASGSSHASWLFVAATMTDTGGQPMVGVNGELNLFGGLLPKEDAQFLDTWHVCGLRATGSDDFVLDDVFIPTAMTFRLTAPAEGHDPLAGLPFLSRLGAGLSFIALGIATHALDLVIELAATKAPFGTPEPLRQRADVQIAVARARGLVESGRAYVTATWNDVEADVRAGGTATTEDQARLRLAYVTAVQQAAAATDLVYGAAGSSAMFEDVGIERCWRDVHAVTQHVAVSPRHLDKIGRVTLGLAPGPGLL